MLSLWIAPRQLNNMQPTESPEIINQRLIDTFGYFENQPAWRLVFSDDQFENRLGTYNDFTSEGLFLCQKTEVRFVPKYRQWIQHKWVLERLTAVPEMIQDELLCKISYEPIWVFEDKKGNPLPPIWFAIEYLIQSIYGVQGKKRAAPVDPDLDPEVRIQKLQQQLFGNESEISDALAYKDGVTVNGDNTTGMGTEQETDNARSSQSTRQIDDI